jgi:hypothetical protein
MIGAWKQFIEKDKKMNKHWPPNMTVLEVFGSVSAMVDFKIQRNR